MDELHVFSRAELLLGTEKLEKLRKARVAVFGIGGVGSFAAEAIARGGVGHIALIDGDTVSLTNINRQLCALTSTVGKPKALVVAERARDINPDADILPRVEFFLPETEKNFDFTKYDFVIDAIDSVAGKLSIAKCAAEAGVPMISCMGTGNKTDPTAFKVSDISKTTVCPLARVMRRELKKIGISHLKVIYSEELPKKPDTCDGSRPVPSSISFVPSVAGLIAAGEAIKTIISQAKE